MGHTLVWFNNLSITSISSSKTANSESVGKAVWFECGLTYHDNVVAVYQLIHLKMPLMSKLFIYF